MPRQFALKPVLIKVWHAADEVRIMAPLPAGHRRGIILGALLVVAGLILPGGERNITQQSFQGTEVDITPPRAAQSQPASASPPSTTTRAPQTAPPVQQTEAADPQWHTYRLASGKTLAQLFRDNNLPVTDVYAMAQVEGDAKPLSNLQHDQQVKIRQNANGVVTGLAIENDKGQGGVLFTRQPNGSFIRVR